MSCSFFPAGASPFEEERLYQSAGTAAETFEATRHQRALNPAQTWPMCCFDTGFSTPPFVPSTANNDGAR